MTPLPRSSSRKGAIRLGVLVLALVFLAPPLPADSQSARKMPTVGYVGLPTDSSESRWQDGFARGLRAVGYVPGHTIVVDVRSYTTGDELAKVLDEFVRQKVDVIFVGQPFVALAARRATRDIPIVCGSCGDPTENGLAVSLASPGGNVTGLASLSAELIGKRLGLMRELFPGVSRHAVFVFPSIPGLERPCGHSTRPAGPSVSRFSRSRFGARVTSSGHFGPRQGVARGRWSYRTIRFSVRPRLRSGSWR